MFEVAIKTIRELSSLRQGDEKAAQKMTITWIICEILCRSYKAFFSCGSKNW